MNWLLVIFSPLLFVLGFLVVRFLYCVVNYQFHKRKFKGMPALKDPLLRLKVYTGQDPTTELWQEYIALAGGKGKPFPSVVFGGPYLELGRPIVFVSSPELLKEVSDDTVFPKLPLVYDLGGFYFGFGLISSSGDYWKQHRTLINPFFFSKKLQNSAKITTRNADEMVEYIRNQGTEEFSTADMLGEVTFRVLIDNLFTRKIDPKWAFTMWKKASLQFGFYNLFELVFGHTINSVCPWTNNLRHNRQVWTEKIHVLCQNARANPNPDEDGQDFVETLVNIKDENGQQVFTDTQIAEECMNMLFAGHDTMKNSLSFTIYFLTKNRHELEKVQQEVDRELKGKTATWEDVPRLQRCKNAFQESMRLRPPVPTLDRIAMRDCTLGGFHIPKGTSLGLNYHAIHMDEAYWKDPASFDPDRFERDSLYASHFYPFSTGPRNCIGQKYAGIEGVILLATMVQHFDIYIGKGEVRAAVQGTQATVGLMCKFIPRTKT